MKGKTATLEHKSISKIPNLHLSPSHILMEGPQHNLTNLDDAPSYTHDNDHLRPMKVLRPRPGLRTMASQTRRIAQPT
jgi:hypothetical protein